MSEGLKRLGIAVVSIAGTALATTAVVNPELLKWGG